VSYLDNWQVRDAGTTLDLPSAAFGTGKFVVLANNPPLLVTEDAINWNKITLGWPAPTVKVAYVNNNFVAVGNWAGVWFSGNGEDWTLSNTGVGGDVMAAAYGNGVYVIAGRWPAKLYTSPDGVNWTGRDASAHTHYGITFGNGQLVAVGEYATISTSQTGEVWQSVTLGTSTADDLRGVAYGNGVYVAVGIGCKILISHDGVEWVPVVLGCEWELWDITFANHTFVAVGGKYSTTIILSSLDGVEWTQRYVGDKSSLGGITYGKDTFLAVGAYGTILQSDPATAEIADLDIAMTSKPVPATVKEQLVYHIAIANGGPLEATGVVMKDTLPAVMSIVSVAPSQGTYTIADELVTCELGSILNGGGATVEITVTPNQDGFYENTANVAAYQYDPTPDDNTVSVETIVLSPLDQWPQRTETAVADLRAVTYGNGTFVAVASDTAILISRDGYSWRNAIKNADAFSLLNFPLYSVIYANGLFVAVGTMGAIYESPDGDNWEKITSGTADTLNGVAYGNGFFIAVGEYGTVLKSTDGLKWTVVLVHGLTETLYGITFAQGIFLAVGETETVVVSADGYNWEKQTLGTGKTLRGVTFGGGNFAVVGDDSAFLTSPDGRNWQAWNLGATGIAFRGVTYGSGFVAVGLIGMLILFDQGSSAPVSAGYTGSVANFYGIAHGNGTYVMVGAGGTIFASADGKNWQGSAGVAGAITTGLAFGQFGAQATVTWSPAHSVNWHQVMLDLGLLGEMHISICSGGAGGGRDSHRCTVIIPSIDDGTELPPSNGNVSLDYNIMQTSEGRE